MMKLVSIILLILVMVAPLELINAQTKGSSDKIDTVTMGWPFDKYSGFHNYAQELIFDREKSKYYMQLAKDYYNEGTRVMKLYQVYPEIYDQYQRDRYRVEALIGTGLSIRNDFLLSYYWYNKSYEILVDKISWDPTLSNNAEYNELVQNTFKNMIYANVYLGNYWGGLYYLDEYKKFKPDENFVEEWEARLKGNIVKIHEKYDWSFTGKMSSAYLKKQHQEMLNKIIDRRYSGDAKLKEELKNRIYPEFVITPEQKTTEEQKSSESK